MGFLNASYPLLSSSASTGQAVAWPGGVFNLFQGSAANLSVSVILLPQSAA